MVEIEGKIKVRESADISILEQETEKVLVPGSIKLKTGLWLSAQVLQVCLEACSGPKRL